MFLWQQNSSLHPRFPDPRRAVGAQEWLPGQGWGSRTRGTTKAVPDRLFHPFWGSPPPMMEFPWKPER